jgi:hypothetical protein
MLPSGERRSAAGDDSKAERRKFFPGGNQFSSGGFSLGAKGFWISQGDNRAPIADNPL